MLAPAWNFEPEDYEAHGRERQPASGSDTCSTTTVDDEADTFLPKTCSSVYSFAEESDSEYGRTPPNREEEDGDAKVPSRQDKASFASTATESIEEEAGPALECLAPWRRADRATVLAAVSHRGTDLRFAAEELRADREVVAAAVGQDSWALEFALGDARWDREIAVAAVRGHGGALEFVGDHFQGDRAVVMEAVCQVGWALRWASWELRGDREVVLAAIGQDYHAMEWVDPSLRQDPEVVAAALWSFGERCRACSAEPLWAEEWLAGGLTVQKARELAWRWVSTVESRYFKRALDAIVPAVEEPEEWQVAQGIEGRLGLLHLACFPSAAEPGAALAWFAGIQELLWADQAVWNDIEVMGLLARFETSLSLPENHVLLLEEGLKYGSKFPEFGIPVPLHLKRKGRWEKVNCDSAYPEDGEALVVPPNNPQGPAPVILYLLGAGKFNSRESFLGGEMGRSGDIRIKSGDFDSLAVTGYPPPLYETGSAKRAQQRSIELTMQHIHNRLAGAPARCTPIAGFDINSGFGQRMTEDIRLDPDEQHFGAFHLKRSGIAGHLMYNTMESLDMARVNTDYPSAGPTYYGPRQDTGTLDIGIIASSLLEGIKTCTVAWKRGRKLQLISDAQPRDHLPLFFTIDYEMPTLVHRQLRPRWDHTKLARALQHGEDRLGFHRELDQRMKDIATQLSNYADLPRPDFDYDLWPISELTEADANMTRSSTGAAYASSNYELADNYVYGDVLDQHEVYLQTLKSEINEATYYVRRAARQGYATYRKHLHQELAEARRLGHSADVHRIARLLAGKAMGVKNRIYCHLPSYMPSLTEPPSHYTNAKSHVMDIPIHCLRANQLPTKFSITEGIPLDKRNLKKQMSSQRIIHLSDAIWKSFYAVPYGWGIATRYTVADSNKLGISNRAHSMTAGRCQLGKFWNERGLWKLKREIFLGKVVEPGTSGLGGFVLKKIEEKKRGAQTAKYLRALMQGRAKTTNVDSHMTAMSNAWKILPVRAELVGSGDAEMPFERNQRQRKDGDDEENMKKTYQAAKQQLPTHTKKPMTLIVKQLLRCAQQNRDMSSAIFDTWVFKSESPLILRIQEQTAARGKVTKEKGKDHDLGPPQIYAMGGLLAAVKELQLEDPPKTQVTKMFADYDNYDNEQKSELVLFCDVDRMYEKEKKRLTLAVREPQFRGHLMQASKTTSAKRKYGRAPAKHMERELQEWVGQLLMRLPRTREWVAQLTVGLPMTAEWVGQLMAGLPMKRLGVGTRPQQ
ncbi:unnamed protein product [Prorocentrum cordatum]|uniref:DUF4116 domain-containing protein n=1 Tax=Prorocentrum cordatum TaxID=2364126 RepID=A0ABN9UHR5_9DINO|nr:unnamed protein product [Polarella glacialis]